MGNSENMFGVGYSAKFGKVSEFGNMTEDQLRDKVSELNDSNKALKANNEELQKKLTQNSEDDAALKKQLSDLQSKVSFLMEKLEAK